jgi:hypothetical protein
MLSRGLCVGTHFGPVELNHGKIFFASEEYIAFGRNTLFAGEGWGILNAVHAERRDIATQEWLEKANN